MRTLTEREKKRLTVGAERVAEADEKASELRRGQEVVWDALIHSGVPARQVARYAGVTDTAVRNRLNRMHVAVSRGSGGARAAR